MRNIWVALIIGILAVSLFFNFYHPKQNENFCNSQASPRNLLSQDDSKMFDLFNADGTASGKMFIQINSEDYKLTLSNPIAPTGSMNPAVPNNAKVIMIDVQANPTGFNYQIGDIVCFWNKGYLDFNIPQICHRIIDTSSDKLLTKGDNNQEEDGWINKADVFGVVAGVVY